MVEPGIEGHAALAQFLEAFAERGTGQHVRRRIGVGVAHLGAGVPAGGVANTAKARAGSGVGIEHVANRRAEVQVCIANDCRAGTAIAVAAARAHRRDAIDELGFAHRPQCLGTVGAVHRAALHEYRRDDVVAAPNVRQQLVKQVAAPWVVPQVVMRVANGQVGFQHVFLHLRQPIFSFHRHKSRRLAHRRFALGRASDVVVWAPIVLVVTPEIKQRDVHVAHSTTTG